MLQPERLLTPQQWLQKTAILCRRVLFKFRRAIYIPLQSWFFQHFRPYHNLRRIQRVCSRRSVCGGDPVNFGDYNGKSAEITINGTSITINMAIVLYGPWATKEVRDRFQNLFNETWGNQKSITYNGQEYSIDWHVTITAKEKVTTKEKNKGYEDGYHNYLKIVNNNPYSKQKASQVTNNSDGQINKNMYWSDTGWNDAGDFPHEFGHLLGLKDHYDYEGEGDNRVPVVDPGWEGEMMSSPAGKGRVTNKTLLPVLGPLINDYNKSIINRLNPFGKKYYINHNVNSEKK